MSVIKRNGEHEDICLDKIYRRMSFITNMEPKLDIDILPLVKNVIQGLSDNINTYKLDEYAANVASSLCVENPVYLTLAGRISVDNHHKNTKDSFLETTELLRQEGLVSEEYYQYVMENPELNNIIDYSRDFLIKYRGFKVLEKSYLLRNRQKNIIYERPQDLFMRCSVFIHMGNLKLIKETYDVISLKKGTHATPTLFNAGTNRPQCASCFLLGEEDSAVGLMKSNMDKAIISKYCGGIGFHCSSIRSRGAPIKGTNGLSNGIIPFLKLSNDVARAFNQGGKRRGAFAAFLETWHPDILDFLNLRKNRGDENMRTRDLMIAVWVSDLFMKKVENDEDWNLFDPNTCPKLQDSTGEKFQELYEYYSSKNMATATYPARKIWKAIYESQSETGQPYIGYKDTVNRHSNQQNLGTIKSSNLCHEIMEYSDDTEYAVCNLASVCLPEFVMDTWTAEELKMPENERRTLNHEFPAHPRFDYKELMRVVQILTRNLDKVIDKSWYPLPETKRSNMAHRPIGIGVQGLADVYFKFRIAFDSPKAKELNRHIFESMYYASLIASTNLAKQKYQQMKKDKILKVRKYNPAKTEKCEYEEFTTLPKNAGAYPSCFHNGGSPLSHGKFHWEDYGVSTFINKESWDSLREHIKIYGTRCSLHIALMPTVSTSQIMGNNDCFEPYTSNIFKVKGLAGEFFVVNKYLIHELQLLGVDWTTDIKNYIKENEGSIAQTNLPEELKDRFRTVWEMSPRVILDQAIDRQPFVDQGQSMNLYVSDMSFKLFNNIQFLAWSKGLKTGCYYMRSKPAVMPQKFTLEIKNNYQETSTEQDEEVEECLMCSS